MFGCWEFVFYAVEYRPPKGGMRSLLYFVLLFHVVLMIN
jgi:hypothetical protein